MKPDIEFPRLLLVEDDPVSAAFLREAAAALPAHVDTAATVADALAIASTCTHALYLVDANLPDGDGATLLAMLRGRGLDAPALAHTAADDSDVRERLLDAGFADVMVKPISVGALHRTLRAFLPVAGRPGGKLPCWDDAAALGALGQQSHVDALRRLFLQELPGQRQRIETGVASQDVTAVRAELHRMAASCGFVGASRLGAAVKAAQSAPLDAAHVQRLGFAMDDLLAST